MNPQKYPIIISLLVSIISLNALPTASKALRTPFDEYRQVEFTSPHNFFLYPSMATQYEGQSNYFSFRNISPSTANNLMHSFQSKLPYQFYLGMGSKNQKTSRDLDNTILPLYDYLEGNYNISMAHKIELNVYGIQSASVGVGYNYLNFKFFEITEENLHSWDYSAHIEWNKSDLFGVFFSAFSQRNLFHPSIRDQQNDSYYHIPSFFEYSLSWISPSDYFGLSFTREHWSIPAGSIFGKNHSRGVSPIILNLKFKPIKYLTLRHQMIGFKCHYPGIQGAFPLQWIHIGLDKIQVQTDIGNQARFCPEEKDNNTFLSFGFFMGWDVMKYLSN